MWLHNIDAKNVLKKLQEPLIFTIILCFLEPVFLAIQQSRIGEIWVWFVHQNMRTCHVHVCLYISCMFTLTCRICISAVYLEKRFLKNKQKYSLDEYELVRKYASRNLVSCAYSCDVFAGISWWITTFLRQHLVESCLESEGRNQVNIS